MEIKQALLALSEAKLSAEFIDGKDQRIIGGIEVSQELGFNVYKKPFAIYQENSSWVIATSGPGQLDTNLTTNSLQEAVVGLTKIYTSGT